MYFQFIPVAFFKSNLTMKVVIRLLFHPLLNEVNQIINRLLIQSYPNECVPARTMVVFLMPLYVFANITGRFLVTSLPDLLSTALVSVALGAIELFFRISLPWYNIVLFVCVCVYVCVYCVYVYVLVFLYVKTLSVIHNSRYNSIIMLLHYIHSHTHTHTHDIN